MMLRCIAGLIAVCLSLTLNVMVAQAQSLSAESLPTQIRQPVQPQVQIPSRVETTIIRPTIRPTLTQTKWTGRISPNMNLVWASNRDLTSSDFAAKFKDYSDQGLMITDVDAYLEGKNDTQYAMIWQANPDGRKWKEHRNMTSESYHEKWEKYKSEGYRPLDVEVYLLNEEWRYAGIWVENRENLDWWSRRNMDSDEYGSVFKEKSDAGYRLIDMEAYNTSDGLRYSAIWYKNVDNIRWAQLRNMTREGYNDEVAKKNADGFVMIDYESYETDSGQRYAAIWEENVADRAWVVRTDRKEDDFANYWREYLDKGFRIVDFERYETPNGTRYGAIWAENNPERQRYARKGELDTAVQNYLDENSTKGISLAVIKDGDILYRRGFGWADKGRDKAAWGGNIYNLASISKVVGGTLAAKLEALGRLEDGQSVSLDLKNPTSSFIKDLPSQHTHTVEQLLAHLACIPHYNTNPSISNTTKHYVTAKDALDRFVDKELIKDCRIGSYPPEYSSAAFTFIAAALEEATGKPIDVLVNEEIIQPHHLGGSMKVQYEERDLPENYDRAKRYSGDIRLSGWPDTSWKVLGGGIESNAVDLARFGWKVLSGQIVSPSVRDNRLWQSISPSSYGLAWSLESVGGRRVAEHGGFQTGARSYLRVYRDDGLVIAVLSNQANHPIRQLVTTLGNIVLR
jgi:CubicO group peptidase (beta-lactamase class C family)